MKILIADNEKNFVLLLKKNLAQKGYAVDVAYDGKEALGLMLSKSYDLVFLDFNMPQLTGLELAKYIKEKEIRSKVVIITGYADMSELLARAVGADEYMTKPISVEDVKEVIDKYDPQKKAEKK